MSTDELFLQKYIDIPKLKELASKGLIKEKRAQSWRILLNFQCIIPFNFDKQIHLHQKKYFSLLNLEKEPSSFTETQNAMHKKLKNKFQKDIHQIEIDLKRLKKHFKSFNDTDITFMFNNILMLFVEEWPWVGYVQGMSDILVPILHVFCTENIDTAESSSYFAFTNLFIQIYHNFTEKQPGILLFLSNFASLLYKKDEKLFLHLRKQNVLEHFYAFRWINCLFTREFGLNNVLLIFDAMLSNDIELFLISFSVSLICFFRERLLNLGFNEILLFLQEIDKMEFNEEIVSQLISSSLKK